MTFKEGDIVRLRQEDNDGEAMRVLDVDGFAVHVAIGNDDGERWLDTCDIEMHPTHGFGSSTHKPVTSAFTPQEKIESCLSDIGCNLDRIRDLLKGM
jgi:hypothetical protein